ncbi:MAG: hypothetical protein GY943_35870 [Chloroflexi bacterium]|nr:hypothetical protein [Chloroflexota bacterium]
MVNVLLNTKLYCPQKKPALLSRSRLHKQLNARLIHTDQFKQKLFNRKLFNRKLSLISAPAGFGKTTLVSEWVSQTNIDVGWLSLDAADNDLVRFTTYFIAALQQVPHLAESAFGDELIAMLHSPQLPDLKAIWTMLVNGLTAVSHPIILVLDDYHLIQSLQIHELVTFFCENLPAPLHLVIASRTDPPLPLARLRARQELVELRAADLRFTTEETAVFLNNIAGLNLSSQDIAALETRTEGWIAGLQLATLSMHNVADKTAFIQAFTGSHRYVLDYLMEEVLNQQPKEIHTFLLKTAVLNKMCAPLCAAVLNDDLGDIDLQSILVQLESQNLFTLPIDNERRWFRYHHLFAELLQFQLTTTYPNDVQRLHQRAAQWFAQNNLIADAITHALQTSDAHMAAQLIEQQALTLISCGETQMLMAWITQLPPESLPQYPRLLVYLALCQLLTNQIPDLMQTMPLAMQAAANTTLSADEATELHGYLNAIQSYMHVQQRDVAISIKAATQALVQIPETNQLIRSFVLFSLGGTKLMMDDVEGATEAFARTATIAKQAGNLHLAAPAARSHANMMMLKGRLYEAETICREMIKMASGRDGRPYPILAGVYGRLSTLAYEWNQLDQADTLLQTGIQLGKQWGNLDPLVSHYGRLAQLRQAQGDLPAAATAITQAYDYQQQGQLTPGVLEWLRFHEIQLWLAQGDLARAVEWTQQESASIPPTTSFFNERTRRVMAHVYLANGNLQAALDCLTLNITWTITHKFNYLRIKNHALQALVYTQRNQDALAVEALQTILPLAAAANCMRTFIDLGRDLSPLFNHPAIQSEHGTYVNNILRAMNKPSTRLAHTLKDTLIEPLSERETEIMQLVADGLSNREIATQLVITIGTVKSHTNHIYSKLGVKSRTQAIVMANKLGLISHSD